MSKTTKDKKINHKIEARLFAKAWAQGRGNRNASAERASAFAPSFSPDPGVITLIKPRSREHFCAFDVLEPQGAGPGREWLLTPRRLRLQSALETCGISAIDRFAPCASLQKWFSATTRRSIVNACKFSRYFDETVSFTPPQLAKSDSIRLHLCLEYKIIVRQSTECFSVSIQITNS